MMPADMQNDWLLTINCGSTSIKFACFDAASLAVLAMGSIRDFPARPQFRVKHGPPHAPGSDISSLESAIGTILAYASTAAGGRPKAIGHRIVHGGKRERPALIDAALLDEMRALQPLAPLHQPACVAAAALGLAALPSVPNIALFDTAFHRTMPEIERRLPLPQAFAAKGMERFGFHGLSFQSVATRLRARFAADAGGRVVAAHLGGGSSLCAMVDGKSNATTMGMTPAGGVPMTTRSGDLDPGIVLALVRELGVDGAEDVLNRQSGLYGLSGRSDDAMALLAANDDAGRLALAIHVRRIAQAIAAMATAMGGIDTLVFTGGIGANAPELRRMIVEACAWMGLSLDGHANAHGDERLESAASTARILKLKTGEEEIMASEMQAMLSQAS